MKASETSALIEVIKEQNKTIESLRKTIEEMSVESKILREQIEYLTKKLFGTKSEKMAALTGQIVLDEILNPEMSQDLGLFNEAETNAEVQEEPDLRQKATKKGYSREKALRNLPREEKLYTLPDEDRVCSMDGDRLVPAGKKYLRTEIEYTPASMKLVEVYVETAECRTCRKEGRSYLRQAEADQPVLQHSMASPSSVAWTMYQKYVNHVPLYRQEKDWHNLGLEIQRNTLSSWIMKTSEEWLSPVVARLREKLLEETYLHADELCEASHNSSYVESYVM
ncbi:transposase [Proteiniclasticum sp. BAD-10]|uniref:Transposase n=1 Tax=Proteiniclasticum sediminis TaxID=2804028 RepID=A0A941HRD8_9CLOT|nr:transposase [Proteiniclasticum sediminis]MBR0577484.1 transposase [Proteiniclasticum sediminis]